MSNIANSILKLEKHQTEAYKEVEKLFKNGKYAAVIFPTGCGKSFVTLKYILEHPDEKILFLSPRCAIKEQMYEYIVRFIGGMTESIEEIRAKCGSMEDAAQSFIPGIKAMLYQSVLQIGEKESIDNYIKSMDPDLIVVDEMHHLKTKKNNSDNYIEDDEETVEKSELEEDIKEQNKWGKKFKELLALCPKSKVLGLSATPIRTDGANVVERIFENSIAAEKSLLEAMEDGIIIPPKYVVADFIRKDELQTLLEKIEEADEERKEQLKQEYDILAKKSDEIQGISDLMQENITKKDGKYIIFCKDINDMEEKKEKAKEWFGKIDEEPVIYAISSKDSNSQKYLNEFNNDNSKHLKLMYCVGMIDEGVHLNNISGVVLAAKTGSRTTYLQRIGRTISSGNNKKQTLVIDLVNNNEILFEQKCRENGYIITDIEALDELAYWIKEKNEGKVPDYENAKTDKERQMAKRFLRLNNKYYKYIENEGILDDLSEGRRNEIEQILALGKEINLWNQYIEINDEREKKINKYFNKFLEDIEIKGVRRELLDLLSKKEISPYLKNTMKIENWCKEKYGDKPIWERNLPNRGAEDEEENGLAVKLSSIRQNIIKKHEGKVLEEIEDEEDRKIVEIINELDTEYGLGGFLKNAMKIENWCKDKYEGKPIWERKLPNSESKNAEEEKLGEALSAIRQNIIKKYEGKILEEIENQEDRKTIEIINKLDAEYGLSVPLKNAIKIKNWCKERYEGKPIWERNLPNSGSRDEEEKRLGAALTRIRQKIINKYEGKVIEEIENQEDRKIVEIINKLDTEYGLDVSLKKAMKIENWCKNKYEDKPIWERSLPNKGAEDEEEKRLGAALGSIRQNIIKKYEGKKVEEIEDEEDRKIVEIINKLDAEYGLSVSLKNAIKIKNWCKEKYEDKPIWERKLPNKRAEDEEEKRLGDALRNIRKRIIQYEGKEVEEIEDEQDRKIVEIITMLDAEYNPKKAKIKELEEAKELFEKSKEKNEEVKVFEQQMEEQLNKREKTEVK